MITEKDLQEAIAECQGVRNPNASTCIKLAAFLIIQEHLYGTPQEDDPQLSLPAHSYSSSPGPVESTINYYGDTEFAQAIDGKTASEIWPVIDELMTVLQATNPRLYAGVMRKIED